MQAATATEQATNELVSAFAEHGLALSPRLVEMLSEHYSHRTERRGCGFTQASRHLATAVNLRQPERRDAHGLLFARPAIRPVEPRAVLLELRGLALREESRLLLNIISDLIEPTSDPGVPRLPLHQARLEIGTCSLAEKYFLELANGHLRRGGRVNVLVTAEQRPVLVEKEGLGDNHSCISLTDLSVDGVRLPKGSLFGVQYDDVAVVRDNRDWPGKVISIDACAGFRFLRLTTLAVSPVNRMRAFSSQFEAQISGAFFSPGSSTVAQLEQLALEQV